jgi:DNA-binding CsgD family transcriptional regulator
VRSTGAGEGRGLSPSELLTPRERDVVRLLRAGKPYKVIATELGITASTARVIGARALRKLGGRRLALPNV